MTLEINYKGKTKKKHQHMETKQHSTKQPMAQMKKKEKKLNTQKQVNMKTHFKT